MAKAPLLCNLSCVASAIYLVRVGKDLLPLLLHLLNDGCRDGGSDYKHLKCPGMACTCCAKFPADAPVSEI